MIDPLIGSEIKASRPDRKLRLDWPDRKLRLDWPDYPPEGETFPGSLADYRALSVDAKRSMWGLLPLQPDPVWPLDAPPLEGRKDDGGKARHDLLAPEYLTGTAEILAFGASKYGARNWEKGMAWSRPFAAMMRHMWAWWAGEQFDPETGKSHLWHASCCLMFLVAYEQRKTGTDDRPNSA